MKEHAAGRSQVVALLLGLSLSLCAFALRAATAEHALIPKPASLQSCAGALTLDARSAITVVGDARSGEIASFLRDAIVAQNGVALAIAREPARRPGIALRLDPAIAGDEAYRLDIGEGGATITASGERGLLWGVQTLRQLLPAGKQASMRLPCLRIEDAPALAYRGQMLDVARHFFPVEFVKRQLDVLSYYKINTFRWHLTDDQGWRIRIERYPRLTGIGGWRSEPDGRRHGGYYTQDDVREVVEYARRRGIMVIPEIEMPGHATAALVAYPELACAPPPAQVPSAFGVHDDIFCAGKEETFRFLENVLDEVVALFPAPYLHIGGDEAPKARWQACDACQTLMRREGLKDEGELQSWFVRRIQRYLRGKGRTLVGWDEILEGGADRDAVIEVWRGEAEGRKALENGNRIVNAGPYYLDGLQDQVGLRELYSRDPLADPAYRAAGAQVWGAEAPLWSERITPLNGEAMLYPRMLAFAEIAWNAGRPRDFDEFRRRLAPHYRWLEARGIAYGPEEAPIARYALAFDREQRHWRLQARHGFADMRSHYRLDGQEPGIDDPAFADEVAIDLPGELRVAPFRGDRQALEGIGYRLVSHRALGVPVRAATPPKPPYADMAALTDGIEGGLAFGDGRWVGWQGPALEAVLDLGETRDVRRIATGFLQETGSWIVLPRAVTYALSDDGMHWREVDAQDLHREALYPSQLRRQVEWRAEEPLRARWVKVVAQPYGALPQGHPGAGHRAWLFADEIVVE